MWAGLPDVPRGAEIPHQPLPPHKQTRRLAGSEVPAVKDSAKETITFNCYCRSDNNSSLAAPAGQTPLRRGWKHGGAVGTLFKISEGLKSIKPDQVYVNSQLLNNKSLIQWCSEHFTGGSSAEVCCIYSTQ